MKITAAFLAALLVIAALPAIAVAQDQTATEPTEAENAVLELGELIAEIASERDATTEQIATINNQLDTIIADEASANQMFDEMIASEREKAELGDPSGPFVINIRRLAETARERAASAGSQGLSDIARQFEANAEVFEDSALRASQYFEGLDLRISAIEAERDRIVFLIQLNEQEKAKEVIQDGLNLMKKSDNRLEALQKRLQEAESD